MRFLKLKTDENNVALLDTKTERLKMVAGIVVGIIGTIAITACFAWLPYWIVTGNNMYKKCLFPDANVKLNKV